MAYGHTTPHLYPVGWLQDEAEIIRQRENHRIATEAHLIQLAASSILSKEAGQAFSKEIAALIGVEPPEIVSEERLAPDGDPSKRIEMPTIED